MNESFIKKLSVNLMQNGFRLMNPPEIQEKSTFFPPVFFKIENPIFYVVSILDSNTDPKIYEHQLSLYLEHLKKNLSQYYCTRFICVTLAVDNSSPWGLVDFVQNKEFIPGELNYHIWWHIDLLHKKITTGTGQPEKILNLQDIVLSTFVEEPALNLNQSIHNIEQQIQQNDLPRPKSFNMGITAFLLVFHAILFFFMVTQGQTSAWISQFGVESFSVFQQKEYYRLFTALFLHGNLAHLLQNSIFLFYFGSKVEILYGKSDFLLLYFFSGLCGSVCSVLWSGALSIGASGAIFGLIGAILVFSRTHKKLAIGMNYATLLLFVVFGLISGFVEPNVDLFAHFGGFFSGSILSYFLLSLEHNQ